MIFPLRENICLYIYGKSPLVFLKVQEVSCPDISGQPWGDSLPAVFALLPPALPFLIRLSSIGAFLKSYRYRRFPFVITLKIGKAMLFIINIFCFGYTSVRFPVCKPFHL